MRAADHHEATSGMLLPTGLLVEMERFFGQDLSAVRLHVSTAARWLNARAFTIGPHIVVDPDHYSPDTVVGRQLIAHELTHVLQQRGGRPTVSGKRPALLWAPVFEAEADRLGWRAVLGLGGGTVRESTASLSDTPVLQCDLARTTAGTDLATLMRLEGDNPASSPGSGAVGYTTKPKDARPMSCQITYQETGNKPNVRYTASVSITNPPFEGNNTSHYLQAGIYDTNLSLDKARYQAELSKIEAAGGDVTDYLIPWERGPRGTTTPPPNRIYLVLSGDISKLNRGAEQEHCNDYRYAYEETLGNVYSALQAMTGEVYGPADTEAQARELLLGELRWRVGETRQRLGDNMGAWFNEYQRLIGKSIERDHRRYHRFGMAVMASPPEWPVWYLTGAKRDGEQVFIELTPGHTQIYKYGPSEIIV